MKAKLQAGVELDLLTQTELREELQAAAAWRTEIARGVRWRKFSAQGNVATGVWTIGGAATPNNDKDQMGPQDGFVWSVTRVAVSGNGFVAGTDLFSVFVDENTPSKLVTSGLTRWQPYDVGTLVLNGGEQLLLTGAGTGLAGTDVTVSGQAIELPVQLAWRMV